MIEVQGGKEFEAVLWGAEPGLVGTIGFEVIDPPDTIVIADATTQIEESDVVPGTYTARRTAPLAPPATGQVYLGVWLRAGVDPDPVEEIKVYLGPPSADSLIPDVSEVAALLRARTKDSNGNELGTFNDSTRPTGTEAQVLIAQAAAEVAMRVGPAPPADLLAVTRFAVALRAATLIESSYFPEQINAESSAYTTMRLGYEDLVRRVTVAPPRVMIG